MQLIKPLEREAAMQVAECTSLLDELYPGWFYNIDETAHASLYYNCFLTQGTNTRTFHHALEKVRLKPYESFHYGLYVDENKPTGYRIMVFNILNRHWVKEVNIRLISSGFRRLGEINTNRLVIAA